MAMTIATKRRIGAEKVRDRREQQNVSEVREEFTINASINALIDALGKRDDEP
jgi:hypothetical protein